MSIDNSIQLSSGKYFDLKDIAANTIDINDIAFSLSNICRFTGHCSSFYSVAQHCVLTSYIVAPEYAFQALMHDASEAVLGDVASPLKRNLSEYKAMESQVEEVIAGIFGLPKKLHKSVKHADLTMLATERRDLMPKDGTRWPVLDYIVALDAKITPISSVAAEALFLRRYKELTGNQVGECRHVKISHVTTESNDTFHAPEFEALANALPSGFEWGDPLQPHILSQIIRNLMSGTDTPARIIF